MVDLRNDWMLGNPLFGKLFEVNFGLPMPPMGPKHPHHPHRCGEENGEQGTCDCKEGPCPDREHHHHHPHHVRVNVIENESDFVIELCVPGMTKEDLNLYVEDDVLHVETVKKEQQEPANEVNYLSREFGFGPFEEAFELPDNADMEKISAKTENGILTVSVAKKEKNNEVKKIEIM